MVVNMRGQTRGSLTDYLTDTIRSVFPYVYTSDVTDTTNRELFAGSDSHMIENLDSNISRLSDQDLRQLMTEVSVGPVKKSLHIGVIVIEYIG